MRFLALAALLLLPALAGAQGLPFTSPDPNLQENLEWLANQAKQNKAAIASGIGGGTSLNAGAIIAYASSTVPADWLECDGSGFLNTAHPDLFAAIECSWGCSDATHFNVPDFRGRFPRGWDHTAGNDPDAAARTALLAGGAVGDKVGSYQADQFKSHTHTNALVPGNTFSTVAGVTWDNTNTGATGGTETRPKNANVIYIIKATNASSSSSSSGGGSGGGAVNVTDTPIIGTGEASSHIRIDTLADLTIKSISMSGGISGTTATFGSSFIVSTGARVSIGYLTTPTTVQLDVAGLIRTSSGIVTMGGNARGLRANDLQVARSANTQVASGQEAAIGGGYANTCSGITCVVGGGQTNANAGDYSGIPWGRNNVQNATDSGVSGSGNTIDVTANESVIAGGYGGHIYYDGSSPARGGVICGGYVNTAFNSTTVCGGGNNYAGSQFSATLGGENLAAQGNYAYAFGNRCKATANGAVCWSDTVNADFTNATANSWRLRYSGGYYFSGGKSTFSFVSVETGISASTATFGTALNSSTFTVGGFFQLVGKTRAEIDLLVPAAGSPSYIDCTDCTLPGPCRSTGTLASQWRKVESATLGCGTNN